VAKKYWAAWHAELLQRLDQALRLVEILIFVTLVQPPWMTEMLKARGNFHNKPEIRMTRNGADMNSRAVGHD